MIETKDLRKLEETPKDIVLVALERGAPVDVIERVVRLRQSLEADAARRAWQQALARAQAEMPVISRTRTARIQSARGAYSYDYTPLEDVVHVAGPVLTRHGFSWRWDYEFGDAAVTATCYLSHGTGHTECATFRCPVITKEGGNAAHAVASARTYAARYAFISVAGIVVGGEDDDAAAQTDAPDDKEQSDRAKTAILARLMQAQSMEQLRELYKGLDRSQRSVLSQEELAAVKRTVEERANAEHDLAEHAAQSRSE
ncbi:ERF family protein [Candidatus Saccharibacteria bacterium]|nr:ERF family protein [Candidatus Saccharibacteria bacterium]